MGFPIKDVVATCHFEKSTQWMAYLKINGDVITVSKNGIEPDKYVPSQAIQVEFTALPDKAQDYFVDRLTELNVPLNARGLFKLPELIKIEERDVYVIMQKRTRMRHNNYRIFCGEQEVHKAETIKAARQWCDNNIEDN